MDSPGRSLDIWPASTSMPFGTASWTRSVHAMARGIDVGTSWPSTRTLESPYQLGNSFELYDPISRASWTCRTLARTVSGGWCPTLAGIARLTDTERLAIGQWTDAAGGSSTAQTPLRYDARKQKQGHQLRLAAALFLAGASELLWEEIKSTSAAERWAEAMIAALLSENPRVVRVSSDDIPGMPTLKSFPIDRARQFFVSKKINYLDNCLTTFFRKK